MTAAGRAKRDYKAKGEKDSKEKEDEGWVQVVRLTNRLVASTLMFTLPPVVFAYNMKECAAPPTLCCLRRLRSGAAVGRPRGPAPPAGGAGP